MQKLSYELRSKPDWIRKSQDPTIRQRWRVEALEARRGFSEPLSARMVDYVLDELVLHAERKLNGIEVSTSGPARDCSEAHVVYVARSDVSMESGSRTTLFRATSVKLSSRE